MKMLNEKKLFNRDLTANSIKLFGINTILYLVFLQSFVLSSLTEQFESWQLPVASYFAGGLFALFYVLIWHNLGDMLCYHVKSETKLLATSVLSELPFVIILAILWWSVRNDWQYVDGTLKMLLLILSIFILLFPAIITLSQKHGQAIKKIEH